MVSKDSLINCSCKLLNTQEPVSRAIEVFKDLPDFTLGKNDVFDLREELKELIEVQLTIAVLVCQLHPVQSYVLHFFDRQGLSRGLRVQHLKNLSFLFLLLC